MTHKMICAAAILMTTGVNAQTIVGDPGLPGDYQFGFFFGITADFQSEFGSTVSGQAVQFDLFFTDDRAVISPSNEGWSVSIAVNHEMVGAFIAPQYTNAWLLDASGNVIRSADGLFNNGGTGQSLPIADFDPVDNELFHGVRFDLTLPDYPTDPAITFVEVSFSNDEVWTIVPEPTSLALLGLGGLLVARRRRAA